MYTSKSIRRTLLILAVFVIAVSPGTSVLAADSILVSYQGYLTGADDVPLTMSAHMEFRIYNNPNGISGTLWGEQYDTVVVTNGLFNVMLGSANALPKSIFDGSDRWLGISVNYDADVLPRPLLGSVINAASASQVHGDIQTLPGHLKILLPDPPPEPLTPVRLELYPPDPCTPPDPCQPALEIVADVDSHVMRLHPPDPCFPPDPCAPAVELTATAELHGFKIHPPEPCAGDPCAPAFELSANPEGNLMRVSWNGSPADAPPAFELVTDVTMELTTMSLTPPPDDNSPSIEFAVDVADMSSCLKMIPPPDDGKPGIEMCTDAGASMSTLRVGGPPPDDSSPAIELTSTTSASTLIVQGQDPAGGSAPPQIVMTADALGASLSIGTDSVAEALTVMGNGWFSGDVIALTDTKVKRNVEPVRDALEKVSRMNGYYYECKTDEFPNLNMPTDRQIGFLAQEVKEVVPEVVSENKLGLTGVSYGRLTALLVEAVKELKSENEELRSRLEKLEER